MSAIHIAVTDRRGVTHSFQGMPEGTLMAFLKDQGAPIAATCSGAKSCATCHVLIAEGHGRVGAPDEDELDLLLESAHYQEGRSRLSCQIALRPGLDGLQLQIAPAE
jgi:ferredoxin, 2Fe-2S